MMLLQQCVCPASKYGVVLGILQFQAGTSIFWVIRLRMSKASVITSGSQQNQIEINNQGKKSIELPIFHPDSIFQMFKIPI